MFNSTNGTQLTMPVVPAGGSGFGTGFGGDGAWFIWIILIIAIFGGWGYGNGFGGFGGNQGSTSVYEGYVLNNDFSQLSKQISDTYNMTDRKFEGIANGICSLGYDQLAQMNGINTNIMTVGNTLQAAVKDCCCQTQQNLADVKYTIGSTGADISRGVERGFADTNFNLSTLANGINTAVANGFCQTNFNAATNTRDIVDSQNAGTQAILARIDALESSRKDEKIAELTAKLNRADLAASQAAQNQYLVERLDPHPCPINAYVVQPPQQITFPTSCCGQFNGCGCNG